MMGISETSIGSHQAPFPVLPEAVRGSRILVIDDNPANVLLLQRLLRTAGLVNVDGYTDPRAALERCVDSVPDLLLLDLHMPPPDGFGVMEALQARLPPDVFLPVLVLTADAGGEIKRRALAAGAKDFLTKPLDNVEVVLRVRNLLETQQLVRHLGDAAARERALRQAAVAVGAAGADRAAIEAATVDAARALVTPLDGMAASFTAGLQPPPAGAVVTIPVATRGSVYGTIAVAGPGPPPPEIIDALRTLAAQVALALEGAALTEALRRREREEAAAVLVQQSSDVITVVDSDLRIRFQTPSAEPVLGYGADALIGTSVLDLVTPEQQESAREYYGQVARTPGAGPPVEWELRRADGSCIPVEAVSNNLLDDPRVDGIVVTLRDITDHKAFEEGLKHQVEELRELDRMQHELVSTVSHELRTPLTSILGHTEMLADGDAGPITPEQAHVVSVIDRNSHRLLALIEDLLTMGRVESRGLDLDLGPVDVASLVDGISEAILPTAAARAQTFTIDLDAQVGAIVADGSLLERALLNLLSNAVKFTPEAGGVTLSVRRDGAQITFSVTDTGIGISCEDQKRLFTRFFRSAVATVNAIPGTGLGLSIVKQIIDAHHGSITLDSVPGCGTTVAFTIPDAGNASE
ncbi:MAG TPA: ATP-binding protein [Acidimicrobiales bacterium]|nr:ATP-binding protein [Acidimicrobiales bacterium]